MTTQPGTAWIAQAYDGWLEALDRAVGFSAGLDPSGVTHVILLGLAQHGKTSLALRLLEATETEAIGEALRGNRLQGQSATPGPIGYYAGPASAATDLADLKHQIENIFRDYASAFNAAGDQGSPGQSMFHSLPEIPIPSANPDCRLKLVDMAGFDGRETWAEAAAAYWTARADFTLLVIQAEKFSQLAGEEFKSVIAQFKNRWTHSDSMLVVTTCSFEQKEDPAEREMPWEVISQRRRDAFHKEILGSSSIPRDKVELYPVSIRPGQGQELDPLTQESLMRLRKRLAKPTLFTKLSNVEVLRQDRIAYLQAQWRPLETERAKGLHRITGLEAVLKDLDDAGNECSAVKDKLQLLTGPNYPLRPVTADTWHDTYKVQEPVNAYDHHTGQLRLIQHCNLQAVSDLHRKWTGLLPPELTHPLTSNLTDPGYRIDPRLRQPIPDQAFKTNHYWLKYDVERSGQNLHRAMTSLEQAIFEPAQRWAECLTTELKLRIDLFAQNLDLAKPLNRKRMEMLLEQDQQVVDRIAELELRQQSIPPIPDLEARLKATFIQAWNHTTALANQAQDDRNTIVYAFMELWAMKEALGQVEARFPGFGQETDPD